MLGYFPVFSKIRKLPQRIIKHSWKWNKRGHNKRQEKDFLKKRRKPNKWYNNESICDLANCFQNKMKEAQRTICATRARVNRIIKSGRRVEGVVSLEQVRHCSQLRVQTMVLSMWNHSVSLHKYTAPKIFHIYVVTVKTLQRLCTSRFLTRSTHIIKGGHRVRGHPEARRQCTHQ